jgi:hypothetical protein
VKFISARLRCQIRGHGLRIPQCNDNHTSICASSSAFQFLAGTGGALLCFLSTLMAQPSQASYLDFSNFNHEQREQDETAYENNGSADRRAGVRWACNDNACKRRRVLPYRRHVPHAKLQFRHYGTMSGDVVRPWWQLRPRPIPGCHRQCLRLSIKAPEFEWFGAPGEDAVRKTIDRVVAW